MGTPWQEATCFPLSTGCVVNAPVGGTANTAHEKLAQESPQDALDGFRNVDPGKPFHGVRDDWQVEIGG
jgi:hypothetical protein